MVEATPAPTTKKPTAPTANPVLKNGSHGERVKQLQECLHYLHYSLGKPGIDAKFGPHTEAAVKKFQGDHKLHQDGIYGAKTRHALVETLKKHR